MWWNHRLPVEERKVTYLGHASLLIERDGTRLLTDPLLRSSLTGFLRRRHAIPELETTGLGAVLISHVHHDHLDLPTLRRIGRHTPLVVPDGAGRDDDRRVTADPPQGRQVEVIVMDMGDQDGSEPGRIELGDLVAPAQQAHQARAQQGIGQQSRAVALDQQARVAQVRHSPLLHRGR